MPPRKKKRGAQPRNLNALKHGFYSRQFDKLEIDDLDNYVSDGLRDEIAMLRIVTRRVLVLAEDTEDLGTATDLLGAIGLAVIRLASLLKFQKIYGTTDTETSKAITEALNTVLKEWGRI